VRAAVRRRDTRRMSIDEWREGEVISERTRVSGDSRREGVREGEEIDMIAVMGGEDARTVG
jgi:hypothetical protein